MAAGKCKYCTSEGVQTDALEGKTYCEQHRDAHEREQEESLAKRRRRDTLQKLRRSAASFGISLDELKKAVLEEDVPDAEGLQEEDSEDMDDYEADGIKVPPAHEARSSELPPSSPAAEPPAPPVPEAVPKEEEDATVLELCKKELKKGIRKIEDEVEDGKRRSAMILELLAEQSKRQAAGVLMFLPAFGIKGKDLYSRFKELKAAAKGALKDQLIRVFTVRLVVFMEIFDSNEVKECSEKLKAPLSRLKLVRQIPNNGTMAEMLRTPCAVAYSAICSLVGKKVETVQRYPSDGDSILRFSISSKEEPELHTWLSGTLDLMSASATIKIKEKFVALDTEIYFQELAASIRDRWHSVLELHLVSVPSVHKLEMAPAFGQGAKGKGKGRGKGKRS